MSEENNIILQEEVVKYDDDNIRHLSDMEHVRTRPGMYIGPLIQRVLKYLILRRPKIFQWPSLNLISME